MQQTGSGEDAVVQKVTWTGGARPDRRGLASSGSTPAPTRRRRTPSTSGRPTRTARSSTGTGRSPRTLRRRRSRRKSSLGGGGSSTLAIVALVVGGLALVVGDRRPRLRRRAVAGMSRRGRSTGRDRRWSRRGARRSRVARGRTLRCCGRRRRRAASSTARPRSVSLTYSEAVEPRFAIVSVTDAAGQQQTAGRPHRSPPNPDELDVPLDHLDAGLVPRLLARDLRRRAPGARRLHVRRRAEPGAGAPVRDPVDQRDGRHARGCSIARWLVFLSRRWPRSASSCSARSSRGRSAARRPEPRSARSRSPSSSRVGGRARQHARSTSSWRRRKFALRSRLGRRRA